MIFLQYVGKEIAMKISPQILKMRLETWGFGLSGNVPGRGMYLGRPVFYTETENEEEERLYILPGGTRLPDRAGTKRQVFVTGPDAEPPSGAKYTILRFSSLQDSCKMTPGRKRCTAPWMTREICRRCWMRAWRFSEEIR